MQVARNIRDLIFVTLSQQCKQEVSTPTLMQNFDTALTRVIGEPCFYQFM